jgi:hypothetical protein
MPPMPPPTMTADMVSARSKMASRSAARLTTRWSSRMPLPLRMASAALTGYLTVPA